MASNVAILGATDDPTKYANMAMHKLQDHGYNPVPVNPSKKTIEGLTVYHSLSDFKEPIDTVTIYVRPSISSSLKDDILAAKPRRVIMNPGAENQELADALKANGIEVLHACTLVLLQTGQF
jgi:hypothetical protein